MHVAISTIPFTTAKNIIADCKEIVFAIKLTIGTPSTIPAETPIITFAAAFGASFSLTVFPATENAKDT